MLYMGNPKTPEEQFAERCREIWLERLQERRESESQEQILHSDVVLNITMGYYDDDSEEMVSRPRWKSCIHALAHTHTAEPKILADCVLVCSLRRYFPATARSMLCTAA